MQIEKKRKEERRKVQGEESMPMKISSVAFYNIKGNLSNVIQYLSYTIRDRYDDSLHPFTSAMKSFRCLGCLGLLLFMHIEAVL